MKRLSNLGPRPFRISLLAATFGVVLALAAAGCASSKSGGAASGGTTGAATGTTAGTAPERGETGNAGTAEGTAAATGRRGHSGTTDAGTKTDQTGQSGQTSSADRGGQPAEQGTAAGETATGAAAKNATLSDAQILGVVKVANDGEVAAGNLAVRKAAAPEVREFAKDMVKDHTEASKKVDQTAAATPLSNSDLSSKLVKDANSQIQALNAQSGKEFDRAYIEGQVKMHQGLLDSIQSNLLPHAQSAQVRQLLEQMRDKVSEHLQQAQQIQHQLASVAAR
jgi:putative membrane protein